MEINFTTDYSLIIAKLSELDPIKYAKTRNYINGAITYLSPYISRGMISTKEVLDKVMQRGYTIYQIEPFIKELCWRDYFQRVAQVKDLQTDIKQPQPFINNYEIPTSVIEANTGIEGIDNSIKRLYQTGYMHNHCRMYTASIVCNIARSHWAVPSNWMYYHLLDGDFASNTCSWQWVAGANSNKLYYADQENINKYTFTNQLNTFLDNSYETLASLAVPTILLNTNTTSFLTPLNEINTHELNIDNSIPTYIYNYYNLDPKWHDQEKGNRILLLDPIHFTEYPINSNCLSFMINLSKNIKNIQIFVGSFETLVNKYTIQQIVYKEHPLNKDYKGIEESRDWIDEETTGYFPSFFAYWKQVEKKLKKRYA